MGSSRLNGLAKRLQRLVLAVYFLFSQALSRRQLLAAILRIEHKHPMPLAHSLLILRLLRIGLHRQVHIVSN